MNTAAGVPRVLNVWRRHIIATCETLWSHYASLFQHYVFLQQRAVFHDCLVTILKIGLGILKDYAAIRLL